MDKTLLEAINSALDNATSKYEDDHHLIFRNESERKRHFYSVIKNRLKDWDRSKTCIYRGCTNRSIRRSHPIQKEGPLREIATNGKVLTPEFNNNTGKLELVEKGISTASVFPGFCETHESLFSVFENSKDLGAKEALSLQIYRSICREIVRLKHEIKDAENSIRLYKEFRNKKLSNYSGQLKRPRVTGQGDNGLYSVSAEGINGFPSKAFLIASNALTAFLRAVEI